jgi:regulator of RNase E activity RraA
MPVLTVAQLHRLRRWNTPTIANALEQVSSADPLTIVNRDETRDFMPEMGPMIGYAMTLVISGGDARPKTEQPDNFARYREYLASVPGPKIVVVQDLDHPRCHGSIWGEVGAVTARALGCVGTITDGAIRDLDEMSNAGFKALARRLCVGHAHVHPVRWNCDVEVFGRTVHPGDLIHADKHGFMVIPPEDQPRLLEAARFMDANECTTVIPAARDSAGRSTEELLANLEASITQFSANVKAKFSREGEW